MIARLNVLDYNQIKLAVLLDRRIENSQLEKLKANIQDTIRKEKLYKNCVLLQSKLKRSYSARGL